MRTIKIEFNIDDNLIDALLEFTSFCEKYLVNAEIITECDSLSGQVKEEPQGTNSQNLYSVRDLISKAGLSKTVINQRLSELNIKPVAYSQKGTYRPARLFYPSVIELIKPKKNTRKIKKPIDPNQELFTQYEISEIVGVNRSYIHQVCHKLGIQHSSHIINEKTGTPNKAYSKDTLYKIINYMGIDATDNTPNNLFESGININIPKKYKMPLKEMLDIMGVSSLTLYRVLACSGFEWDDKKRKKPSYKWDILEVLAHSKRYNYNNCSQYAPESYKRERVSDRTKQKIIRNINTYLNS